MPFYFVFKKHKITEYACHKHMTSNYHCIQRVVRIISMNKRFIHKKCGGFDGCFYAFNESGELYFVHQDARYDLNVACNLLHKSCVGNAIYFFSLIN